MTTDHDHDPDSGKVIKIGHNGLRPEMVQDFTDRVERLMGDLLTEKGEYMQRCKVIREDIAQVIAEAKDAGIPKKSFRAVIRVRELEQKLEAIREDLEDEARETFDQIRFALGDLQDTPLGAAVLSGHPDAPKSA